MRTSASKQRMRALTNGYIFALYGPGEFCSPSGRRWLGLVHGHGFETGGGRGPHEWLWFRCMHTGQLVSLWLDGSWRARPLEWTAVERETGTVCPHELGRSGGAWSVHADQLEFSALARGVYELAQARDLPSDGEIALVAHGVDFRAERTPAFGDGVGGASYGRARLAACVLDRVLPPLGCDDHAGQSRAARPPSAAIALRGVVEAAARAPLPGAWGATATRLSPAKTWAACGWKHASRELGGYIAAAEERFQARREGEREGQGALFNSLTLQ